MRFLRVSNSWGAGDTWSAVSSPSLELSEGRSGDWGSCWLGPHVGLSHEAPMQGLSEWLLGLPHSLVAAFQEWASQRRLGGSCTVLYDLTLEVTWHCAQALPDSMGEDAKPAMGRVSDGMVDIVMPIFRKYVLHSLILVFECLSQHLPIMMNYLAFPLALEQLIKV